MDILKVFNILVCSKENNNNIGFNFDLLSLLATPLTILTPNTPFALLAYMTIFIFWVLIYSSQSAVIRKYTTKADGGPSWINALLSATLLYVFQTWIILLFLKFSICTKTLEWEENDYHLTMQQYNTEEFNLEDGY
jgi:hypothetical protein